VRDVRDRQPALGVHAGHAAERGPGHGRAVVGVVAADEDLALRLAEQVPVAAHHAHHGVVALRAGAGEEDVLELRRRHLGQQLGQLDRRRRRGLEEGVVEGQALELGSGRLDQLAPAVADIHAPQAAHRIEDALALGVPEIDALAALDDARAFLGQGGEVGEGMQEVAAVGGLPFLGAAGARGGAGGRDGVHRVLRNQTCSSRCSRSQGEMTFMNSAYSMSLTSVYTLTKASPSTSCRSVSWRSSVSASLRLRGSW